MRQPQRAHQAFEERDLSGGNSRARRRRRRRWFVAALSLFLPLSRSKTRRAAPSPFLSPSFSRFFFLAPSLHPRTFRKKNSNNKKTDPRPRGARRHPRRLPEPPRRPHGKVGGLPPLQGLCPQVPADRRALPRRGLHGRDGGRVEGDARDDDGDEGTRGRGREREGEREGVFFSFRCGECPERRVFFAFFFSSLSLLTVSLSLSLSLSLSTTKKKFQVRVTPTFFVYRDRALFKTTTGVNENNLKAALDEAGGNGSGNGGGSAAGSAAAAAAAEEAAAA